LGEGGLRIDIELEVNLIACDLGVDEIHFIILETGDQTSGTLWVEPDFCHLLEVDDGWVQVVDDWSVRSDELDGAIGFLITCESLFLIKTISSLDIQSESHGEVRIQESPWDIKKVRD
jgi:hypothetical protein